MKHYSEMSLQEYNKAKASGMFYEVWPEATGNVDEDLEAVCLHISRSVVYVEAGGNLAPNVHYKRKYFYDIIDEEAEYEW